MFYNPMYMIPFSRLKNRRNSAVLLFAILMVCFVQKSSAQASGYMGQRILIGGHLGLSSAVFNYNANMKKSLTSFNLLKTIEVEYILSRYTSLGARYNFMNLGAGPNSFDEDTTIKPDESGFKLIHSGAPGLSLKFFKYDKGALAPIGNYTALNLSLVHYTVWNLKIDDNSTLSHQTFDSNGSKFMIGFEWGTQRVFFDRILFSSAFEFNLLTGSSSDPVEKDYLRSQRYAYLASLHMGLSLIVPLHQKVN